MKLRTQLLLAFCLLAILPLAAIVGYSYVSAERAFRSAVESEGAQLAEDMKDRLGSFRQDLRRRLRGLNRSALEDVVAELEGASGGESGSSEKLQEALEKLRVELGSTLPLLDRLAVTLDPPAPPEAPVEEMAEELAEGLAQDLAQEPAPGPAPEPPQVPEPSEPPVDPAVAAEAALGRGLVIQLQRSDDLSSEIRLAADLVDGSVEELRARWRAPEGGFGRTLELPLRQDGESIGRIQASIRTEDLVESVLSEVVQNEGEILFALNAEDELFTRGREDRTTLEEILPEELSQEGAMATSTSVDGWIFVTRDVPASNLRFGVARPVKDSLQQIRQVAVRNLFFGIALVGLAFLAVLPLTAHITRHLSALTRGAERIAAGDLQARVPVYSENEIGQLARTFNRMAFELSENHRQLLDQERVRREQEIQQRLLQAENSRKTLELDEARSFQLSMLPKTLPNPPGLGVAVYTRTATEVGGDYYDFHLQPDGVLTVAIGDATGHGARAGTMVAVIKSLFSSQGAQKELTRFLADASRTIKSMQLRRMAMSLALIRLEGTQLTVASAGMPPVLVYRKASQRVEEVPLEGMPLGGLAGYPYRQRHLEVGDGDTILAMSDGFPEMLDPSGEAVGYDGVRQLFAKVASRKPQDVVDFLAREVDDRSGERPLVDDTTFVVLQVEPARVAASRERVSALA